MSSTFEILCKTQYLSPSHLDIWIHLKFFFDVSLKFQVQKMEIILPSWRKIDFLNFAFIFGQANRLLKIAFEVQRWLTKKVKGMNEKYISTVCRGPSKSLKLDSSKPSKLLRCSLYYVRHSFDVKNQFSILPKMHQNLISCLSIF